MGAALQRSLGLIADSARFPRGGMKQFQLAIVNIRTI